jgi:putative transposase
MARGTRLDAPGALHHVTTRGIERRDLFLDDEDRLAYLGYLAKALQSEGPLVLAWALMTNHVHLLIRTGARPLARTMHIIGTSYARHFNRRHQRSGYLFEGRYRSFLIEEDAYLLTAVRYVHLNPVKAGLVASLGELVDWPWTGHAALMGHTSAPFQGVRPVLTLFGENPAAARRRLHEWMGANESGEYEGLLAASCTQKEPVVFAGEPIHRNARGAGSPNFADEVMREISVSRASVTALQRQWDLDQVLSYVCRTLETDLSGVREGRRTREVSRARAATAFLAHRDLAMPLSAMTAELGVSISSLSRGLERGRRIVVERSLALPQVN